jgi:hypothetical protein
MRWLCIFPDTSKEILCSYCSLTTCAYVHREIEAALVCEETLVCEFHDLEDQDMDFAQVSDMCSLGPHAHRAWLCLACARTVAILDMNMLLRKTAVQNLARA